MSELRFDDRVVIVTGAGAGLGRAYALAFAARGAKVVVNDLGGSLDGTGSGSGRAADKVVEEIKAAGGEATANYDSVEFGEKIVATAVSAYGKVDVIVNNAGILRDASFAKATRKDWDLILAVHLTGAMSVAKAAWPIFREQRYGRIINVASAAGIYGNPGQTSYSAAKLGIYGFSQTLAREGASRGIHCNVIAPLAASRMTETVMPPDMLKMLSPKFVAPVVLYLAHESCEESGSLFEIGGGWVAKLRWSRAKGAIMDAPTAEDIAAKWDKITTFDDDQEYPEATTDSFPPVMEAATKLGSNL